MAETENVIMIGVSVLVTWLHWADFLMEMTVFVSACDLYSAAWAKYSSIQADTHQTGVQQLSKT